MSDCHTTDDYKQINLTPWGKALRRFFGIPCVECSQELTDQIEGIRSTLAKHNGKADEEVVKA